MRGQHTIAHKISVALLDHIAQVNSNAELDSALGRHSSVALDHRVLNFHGEAHGVDDAAELNQSPIAGALDGAPFVHRNSGVDQIAAQCAETGQRAVLVDAGQPAEADNIGGEYGRNFQVFTYAAHQYIPNVT